jgi:hypothetical protein
MGASISIANRSILATSATWWNGEIVVFVACADTMRFGGIDG